MRKAKGISIIIPTDMVVPNWAAPPQVADRGMFNGNGGYRRNKIPEVGQKQIGRGTPNNKPNMEGTDKTKLLPQAMKRQKTTTPLAL